MLKHPKIVARHMPYTKLLVSNRKDKLELVKRKSKYDKPLKEWQSAVNLIIEGEVCDRSVYWMYDESGGAVRKPDLKHFADALFRISEECIRKKKKNP